MNRYKLVGEKTYHALLMFWKIREQKIKDEDRQYNSAGLNNKYYLLLYIIIQKVHKRILYIL